MPSSRRASPNPETAPRKRAKQERSKQTVETILAATARVLLEVGYDHASTKRIAAEAKISIGSLYQYFPTKEAVVAELIERHMSSVWKELSAELDRMRDGSLEEIVRGFVSAFFNAQHVDPRLRRIFIEEVPRMGKLRRVADVETRAVAVTRSLLSTRREVRRADLDIAAVIVVRAIAHLTYDALRGGAREQIWIDEITALVVAYLTRSSS